MSRTASWIWMEKFGKPLASSTNSARDSMSLNQITAMITQDKDGTPWITWMIGSSRSAAGRYSAIESPSRNPMRNESESPTMMRANVAPALSNIPRSVMISHTCPATRGTLGTRKGGKKYDMICHTTTTRRKLAQY